MKNIMIENTCSIDSFEQEIIKIMNSNLDRIAIIDTDGKEVYSINNIKYKGSATSTFNGSPTGVLILNEKEV